MIEQLSEQVSEAQTDESLQVLSIISIHKEVDDRQAQGETVEWDALSVVAEKGSQGLMKVEDL